jgi:4-hydroxy-tetrahydrodipicolinate synthase
MEFGNLITAMVTPFNQDFSVDYKRAAELAKRLVEDGSEGLVVAGTTGESPTLTEEEKLRLCETTLEAVGDRASIIAGTGTYNTQESIHLTKEAEKIGVHGAMLVCPYYNRPPQEGLYQHFKAIADSTSLPIIIYNIPIRTGRNIEPSTVKRLAESENIVAIKEAACDMAQVSTLARSLPKTFAIYSGNDEDTLPMLALGAVGVISVASHVAGSLIKDMIGAFLSGDTAKATELHLRLFPLFKALFPPASVNPCPVKCSLRLVGFDVGPVRLPLVPCDKAVEDGLRHALREVGLIPA